MSYSTARNYTTTNGEKTSPGSFAIWPIVLIILAASLAMYCSLPGKSLSDLFPGNSGGEFWTDLYNALANLFGML